MGQVYIMSISTSNSSAQKLKLFLRQEARNYGFEIYGIANPDAIKEASARFLKAIHAGYHGSMSWLEETAERRKSPKDLWPDVKSIIMLAMNYGPEIDPRKTLAFKNCAAISVYARHRDYHELIKGRLKQIAGRLAARAGENVKVFVDTAPVLEKPLAAAAGLGWQGKHTNLVNRDYGSWLFLGAIFTSAELPYDAAETDHCGSCKACLTACPTNAFPAPYKLDARRCISYLTIELKEQIPREFRPLIGNRIYGCDDCLAACPWNKFAQTTQEIKLKARDDLIEPLLKEFLSFDDSYFRTFFSGSPLKRIGRDRFIRNCLIAAGNSKDATLVPFVLPHLKVNNPLVRGMAVWALKQLLPANEFLIATDNMRKAEGSITVLREFQ